MKRFVFVLFLTFVIFGISNGANDAQKCPRNCLCFRKTVRCMFLALDAIPQVSAETTILDLRFNNIRDIPPGSFAHLKKLHTLMLNNNHLTSLQDGAFKGLPTLRYLYLYKNRIHSIAPGVFQGLPNLEQLYLHFNQLVQFKPAVFSNLPRLARLYLHANLLHKLRDDVFTGLDHLERLFLHNNKLQHIPSGAFRNMPSLKRLRLDSNALVCDCAMMWLVKMLKDNKSGNAPLQAAATCQAPNDMMGKSLNSMTEDDFHCKQPQIMEGPHDVEVNFGGTIVFTCKVSGDPEPQVVWMRNSNEIPMDDPRFRIMDDGSLRIEHSQDSDMGEYECMAKSPVGEAKSKSARIIRSHEEISTAPARPHFEVVPDSQVVLPNAEQLILRCSASGNPVPDISWMHNDVPLVITQRHNIKDNGTLVIDRPKEHDGGSYRCQASNFLGRISAVADVKVNVIPTFTSVPENLTLKTGGHAQFLCEASGSPPPRISWFRDNLPLTPTQRLYFGNGNTRLHISHVKESDSGQILCRATNSEGTREVTATLRVQVSTRTPPKLIYSPYDIEAFPGSTIELPCKADGDPDPTIQWKREGSSLDPNPRYRISTIGSLYITNVSSEDIGRYECSAFNDFGRATGSGLLTIADETNVAPGDRFVRVAFTEASRDVDNAINQTVAALFSHKNGPPNPSDLFRIIRFPNAPAREIARAAEVYERTLVNIRRHVEAGMSINLTADFNYKEILSPAHLDLVARLSGCMTHRPTNNCSDMCYHSKYRSIDGTCNNLQNPTWGASLTGFRRALKPIYENGFSQPVGWTKGVKYFGFSKPSARLVSTTMIATETITPDEMITHMVMQWGQFLDHDLDHAIPAVSSESWDGIDCKKTCDFAPPCYPIEVPPNDPRVHNRRCIDFTRSSAICGSGVTSVFFDKVQHREQINQLTSYIDASQVYGFTEELAQDLRNLTNDFGLMREGVTFPGRKALMPFAGNQGVDCRRDLTESDVNCFVAGDIRANEQVGLLAMHTLWFREHNRIAVELRRMNPDWNGDTIFQEARKVVGSEMQHITYSHWLPHILGEEGMKILGEYKGYNPNINPGIANVFATAALRFGHSLINPILHRLNSTFNVIPEGHLPLHKAFFAPWRVVDEGGIDPLMRGLYTIPAKLKMPEQNLNTDLTERLFKTAHAVALDLAALNIQRSRDHAIPGYNDWRKFCNMTSAETFDDLREDIKDHVVRQKLQNLYGHPGNIDVWVGGILEDQLPGAKVGPLFRCLLIEQFRRLRDGDRFWYENPSTFRPEQLTQIKQVTLGRVLCDNGDDINDITKNVFILPKRQGGYVDCSEIPKIDLRLWTDCHECKNREHNTISRFTNGRNIRRPRRGLDVSYASDKPYNNSTLVEEQMEDNELNEERIEGIESIIENFQKTLKQMRKKIRKLEQQCVTNKLPKHGHCIDDEEKWRVNNEVWQKDVCTKCSCKQHQISCTKQECAKLPCANPVQKKDNCCPTCPETY